MKISVNKKTFILLYLLLTLLVPAFYLYTQSDSYKELTNIEMSVWLESLVLLLLCLCVASLLIKNKIVSFCVLFVLCFMSVLFEPIALFLSVPFVYAAWCFYTVPRQWRVFCTVLFGGCGIGISAGIVILATGIGNFMLPVRTFYPKLAIVFLVCMLLHFVPSLVLLVKDENKTKKPSGVLKQKNRKKRQQNETRQTVKTLIVLCAVILMTLHVLSAFFLGFKTSHINMYCILLLAMNLASICGIVCTFVKKDKG